MNLFPNITEEEYNKQLQFAINIKMLVMPVFNTQDEYNTAVAAFSKFVDKQDEKWLWNGGFRTKYSSAFKFKTKTYNAARFSWYLRHLIDPYPFIIAHEPMVCHEPKCVNPDHLKPKTNKMNMEDKLLDKTNRPGQECHLSTLNDQLVEKIRSLKNTINPNTGKFWTQRELATKYNTTYGNIGFIHRNETWKHI